MFSAFRCSVNSMSCEESYREKQMTRCFCHRVIEMRIQQPTCLFESDGAPGDGFVTPIQAHDLVYTQLSRTLGYFLQSFCWFCELSNGFHTNPFLLDNQSQFGVLYNLKKLPLLMQITFWMLPFLPLMGWLAILFLSLSPCFNSNFAARSLLFCVLRKIIS